MIAAPGRTERTCRDVVATKEEPRALLGKPTELVLRKQLSALDPHACLFIARSAFALLGTSNAKGMGAVSPKGDAPGIVRVLDDQTLAIPDRAGHRRVDSLTNIPENPHGGLLFLVPGTGETFRVDGSAVLVRDSDLLASVEVQGKRPTLAIVVAVAGCFLHCPKASTRSNLWDPSRFTPRSEMPSLARILMAETKPAGRGAEEHERVVRAAGRRRGATPRCLY